MHASVRRNHTISVYTDAAHCGMAGLDLAFVEQGHRYHTPRDVLSAVRAGSLQALGDNVVAFASAYIESRVPAVQLARAAATTTATPVSSSTVYYTGEHCQVLAHDSCALNLQLVPNPPQLVLSPADAVLAVGTCVPTVRGWGMLAHAALPRAAGRLLHAAAAAAAAALPWCPRRVTGGRVSVAAAIVAAVGVAASWGAAVAAAAAVGWAMATYVQALAAYSQPLLVTVLYAPVAVGTATATQARRSPPLITRSFFFACKPARRAFGFQYIPDGTIPHLWRALQSAGRVGVRLRRALRGHQHNSLTAYTLMSGVPPPPHTGCDSAHSGRSGRTGGRAATVTVRHHHHVGALGGGDGVRGCGRAVPGGGVHRPASRCHGAAAPSPLARLGLLAADTARVTHAVAARRVCDSAGRAHAAHGSLRVRCVSRSPAIGLVCWVQP